MSSSRQSSVSPNMKVSCESCGKKVNIRTHKCKVDIKDSDIHKKDKEMSNFRGLCDRLFNILRDSEGLVGDKALKDISSLLALRLLESKIGKEIDIENCSDYGKNAKALLHLARFSNLTKENEDDMSNMKHLWKFVLSVHPSTKMVFSENKNFSIQKNSTFKQIIDILASFDFESMDSDILGDAYEELLRNSKKGRELGQFFTLLPIKKLIISLVNPQVKEDGKIETIFDPAMGSGGFIVSSLKHLIEQSKDKNIPLDWDYIRKEGLGGREIDPDVYNLASTNALISSGHVFTTMEHGDSVRQTIENKYDCILANPPYGIKGLKYAEIRDLKRDEYLPIVSADGCLLFLQLMIYILKIDGRCGVVIPNGQQMSGKSGDSSMIRQYLLKTCDLHGVYYNINKDKTNKAFTNTGVSTCVLHFTKKREGSDVLEIKDGNSNVKINRSYKFDKEYSTKTVKFYNYILETGEKELLTEVDIAEIEKRNYSLNYKEYLENDEKNDYIGVEMKKLGDVCEFLTKSKRPASYGNPEGTYPFFTSSMKVNKFVDEPDYEEESIIIGDGGMPNINYGVKFSTSDHCHVLTSKIVKVKYLYYYIHNNLNIMSHLFNGIGIKNISKKDISELEIPVPSIAVQKSLVKYCDKINKQISDLENEIEKNKKECVGYINLSLKGEKQFENEVDIEEVEDIDKKEKVELKIEVAAKPKRSKTPKKDKKDDEINKYTKEDLSKLGITKLKEIQVRR